MRVVIAEDAALLREGLTRLLEDRGHTVCAAVTDGDLLLAAVAEHKPDVTVVDIRMPPTHTDEGLRAALQLRRDFPGTGVLMFSQYIETSYSAQLLEGGAAGVGYLLKDRVANVAEFAAALERVAGGGTALDPEVVSQLFRASRQRGGLATLTPRERQVLALMAEGRSNSAIAAELVVSGGAVEKHVASIFTKLGLPPDESDNRRVLAVLRYLGSPALGFAGERRVGPAAPGSPAPGGRRPRLQRHRCSIGAALTAAMFNRCSSGRRWSARRCVYGSTVAEMASRRTAWMPAELARPALPGPVCHKPRTRGHGAVAAAKDPDLVSGIVEINPFTRTQKLSLGGLVRIRRYRRGISRLLGTQLFHSLGVWLRYLDVAYPTKPADYADYMAALAAKLREPGRMAEFMKTGKSTPADAGAQLPHVTVPALVIMGSLDPDFADPRAEGDAVVAAMPPEVGTVTMVDGAGHYPHAQCPDEVAALVTGFLKEHAGA